MAMSPARHSHQDDIFILLYLHGVYYLRVRDCGICFFSLSLSQLSPFFLSLSLSDFLLTSHIYHVILFSPSALFPITSPSKYWMSYKRFSIHECWTLFFVLFCFVFSSSSSFHTRGWMEISSATRHAIAYMTRDTKNKAVANRTGRCWCWCSASLNLMDCTKANLFRDITAADVPKVLPAGIYSWTRVIHQDFRPSGIRSTSST